MNIKFIQGASLATAIVSLMLLQACGTTVSRKISDDGVAGEVVFPDAKSAWLREGTFPNVDNLRQIAPGVTKDQLYDLLGRPHFNEGVARVREWDYIFHFRTPEGVKTCQYKAIFDKNLLAQTFHWAPAACADYLKPKVAETMRPAPVAAAVPERIRLGADALFSFDKSGTADILPAGKRQLEDLVVNLKSKYKKLDAITIVGHTDRLGSASYNQSLSLARANTVRDLLAQAGIDRNVIRTSGSGETQPVAECAANLPRAALVSCLQPNRRVDLEVLGQ